EAACFSDRGQGAAVRAEAAAQGLDSRVVCFGEMMHRVELETVGAAAAAAQGVERGTAQLSASLAAALDSVGGVSHSILSAAGHAQEASHQAGERALSAARRLDEQSSKAGETALAAARRLDEHASKVSSGNKLN
ncbi:hypothetical protein T484DRAFT_1797928, partial [Baffinella frigidus]